MARPVTERVAQALLAGARIAYLAQIGHPTGTKYYWTGVGDLIYNGTTFVGSGKAGKISPINYKTNLEIQEIIFELSGVPIDDETWLANNIRGFEAFVWLAVFDIYGNVIPDPKRIIKATLDYPKYSTDDAGNAVIQLVGRSGFYTLERSLDETHSPEDQKSMFPGDTGFDLISTLPTQSVIWKPL